MANQVQPTVFSKSDILPYFYVRLRDSRNNELHHLHSIAMDPSTQKILLVSNFGDTISLEQYNEDLTHKTDTKKDIISIRMPNQLRNPTETTLVWEREPVLRRTKEEFEEFLGGPFEIVAPSESDSTTEDLIHPGSEIILGDDETTHARSYAFKDPEGESRVYVNDESAPVTIFVDQYPMPAIQIVETIEEEEEC